VNRPKGIAIDFALEHRRPVEGRVDGDAKVELRGLGYVPGVGYRFDSCSRYADLGNGVYQRLDPSRVHP